MISSLKDEKRRVEVPSANSVDQVTRDREDLLSGLPVESALFGGEHKEGIAFLGKAEELPEWGLGEEEGIALHFEEVVLALRVLELDREVHVLVFLLLEFVDRE